MEQMNKHIMEQIDKEKKKDKSKHRNVDCAR